MLEVIQLSAAVSQTQSAKQLKADRRVVLAACSRTPWDELPEQEPKAVDNWKTNA